MIIAVDFDGTITEKLEDNLSVGPEKDGAIHTLKQLRAAGHTLVLWTCRGNEYLDAALEWLSKHGMVFDYVNENVHPLGDGYFPRKVFAHVLIDDRNFGGFPGWDVVAKELL